MLREEMAWAGGLFEGEGCFHLNRNRATASLAMSDRDSVERFVNAIGMGRVVESKRGERKTLYRVQINGWQRVQALVAYLWPWLGDRRRATAKAMLAVAHTHARVPGVCGNGHPWNLVNTYIRTDGGRQCRPCMRKRRRRA